MAAPRTCSPRSSFPQVLLRFFTMLTVHLSLGTSLHHACTPSSTTLYQCQHTLRLLTPPREHHSCMLWTLCTAAGRMLADHGELDEEFAKERPNREAIAKLLDTRSAHSRTPTCPRPCSPPQRGLSTLLLSIVAAPKHATPRCTVPAQPPRTCAALPLWQPHIAAALRRCVL